MFFFFFNDTATTEIYTLSLHDALPICCPMAAAWVFIRSSVVERQADGVQPNLSLKARANASPDRKSTRLNSSHGYISYAVFCLKKKKNTVHALLRHVQRKCLESYTLLV